MINLDTWKYTMPKASPNYTETSTIADENNPGYSLWRAHAYSGALPPTFFGASTPRSEEYLVRIRPSINNPNSQQYLVDKLSNIAECQVMDESLEEILPEALRSIISTYS